MVSPRLRIAMIGTRGVPARYGGFETAVEQIGQRLVRQGHEVVVFCRGGDVDQSQYLGMQLVHLPAAHHKIAETLSHTALSVIHRQARGADVAIVFNAANAPLVSALRLVGVPVAVHVDGLEWQRSKWGPVGQRYYRVCEWISVRLADSLIADAVGIKEYYRATYGAESECIAYGAPVLLESALIRLQELELVPHGYHLVVARMEPENHVAEAVEGYLGADAKLPLVVVGSAPYSSRYSLAVQDRAGRSSRVRMLGAVWDQELLDALYAGALSYVHGHSVGGTNPSLLRAMGAGAPIVAFDVIFNREVAGDPGVYWLDTDALAAAIRDAESNPKLALARGLAGQQRAASLYRWDDVALAYERLCLNLATRRRTRLGSRGRR